VSGHSPRRRKRHEEHEEHVNHERWLVTYADMLTLLMVLFIVLFAISQVDQKKFMELATGMASGFGQPVSITDGATSVLPQAAAAKPVTDAAPVMSVDAMPQLASEMSHGNGGPKEQAAAKAAADRDAQSLEQARRILGKALAKAGLSKKVTITRDERGLTVSVVVDDLVFPADSAALQPQGRDLLSAIAPALAETKHDIVVEGHTNTVNVRPKNYPSEWELSSARASSVVRYLVSDGGLRPSTLSVVGYADTRPLVPESDPRSSTLNRRVAIVVLSSLTAEQRALLMLKTVEPGGTTS
jgi:chemotaxis protein MotB